MQVFFKKSCHCVLKTLYDGLPKLATLSKVIIDATTRRFNDQNIPQCTSILVYQVSYTWYTTVPYTQQAVVRSVPGTMAVFFCSFPSSAAFLLLLPQSPRERERAARHQQQFFRRQFFVVERSRLSDACCFRTFFQYYEFLTLPLLYTLTIAHFFSPAVSVRDSATTKDPSKNAAGCVYFKSRTSMDTNSTSFCKWLCFSCVQRNNSKKV